MAERSTLPQAWDVPQEFRDRLSRLAGRQRAMASEGHLLLVLHAPPKPDDVTREARYFWRKPDGTWSSSEFGSGVAALGRHLESYADAIQKCDDQAGRAEAAQDYFRVLAATAPLHRSSRHMHEVLQEAREQCRQDRDLIAMRDRAYQVERTAELLYGETRHALDFAMARRTEDQARSSHRMAVSSHRLNVLVALFFPIATLAALFGVNLRTGLENLAAPLPFLIIVGGGLLAGVVLAVFVTARPHRPAADDDHRRQTSQERTSRVDSFRPPPSRLK